MKTISHPFLIEDLNKLKQLVLDAKRIVIFPHTAPDGDALGSTLALAGVLRQVCSQIQVTVVSPDPIEQYLKWIPHIEELCIYIEQPNTAIKLVEEADLIFHLDHNQVSRLRHTTLVETARLSTAKRVMIDHHLHPEAGYDLAFSYPEYSSTCELLSAIIESLEWDKYLGSKEATLLALGIITDTGRFMYSCFSPSIYQQFARLITQGARYEHIIDRLSYHGSIEELRLRGYVLHEKLEVYPEHGAAIITLSQKEMQERGISKGDTEGLVNLPLSVEGIDCVCFIREDRTQTKISLRSTGSFPVNRIASEGFGGGGHLNAAGGEFQGSIDDARKHFLKHLITIRQQQN